MIRRHNPFLYVYPYPGAAAAALFHQGFLQQAAACGLLQENPVALVFTMDKSYHRGKLFNSSFIKFGDTMVIRRLNLRKI
jgi:hypothetical protein